MKQAIVFLTLCLICFSLTACQTNEKQIVQVSKVSVLPDGGLKVDLAIDQSQLNWQDLGNFSLEISCPGQIVPVAIHLKKDDVKASFLALKPREKFSYKLISTVSNGKEITSAVGNFVPNDFLR